jgi:hypothetical protein
MTATRIVAALLVLWSTPVLTVGASALGARFAIAAVVGLVAAICLAWATADRIARALTPAVGGRPVVAGIALVCALTAIVQFSRQSVFMLDVQRRAYSAAPADPWRVQHNCLTAYVEAARFASKGVDNIYQGTLYQPRTIGPLAVDAYHYPPPFLILPASVRAIVGGDFFAFRRAWFAMQALVLAGVTIGIGVWIGGLPGALTIVGALFTLSTPMVITALQTGNLQLTAIPAAVASFLALCSGRLRSSAVVLAFMAASKVFPGILVVYLLAARRWAAIAWLAAAGAVLLIVTFLTFGAAPLRAFVHDELPAISNGAAFPHAEQPRILAGNQSVYGLTVKLRALALPALDRSRGLAIASAYGFVVVVLALAAGWRAEMVLTGPDARLTLTCTALALVTLASYRSPFVGGVYGLVSTIWLATLLAARAENQTRYVAGLAATFVLCLVMSFLPTPSSVPPPHLIVLSIVVFLIALLVNGAVAVRALRAVPAVRGASEAHQRV